MIQRAQKFGIMFAHKSQLFESYSYQVLSFFNSFSPKAPAHLSYITSGKEKKGVQLLPFSTDCSKVLMCHTKMISQHKYAFSSELHRTVCDLAEQSWALVAAL